MKPERWQQLDQLFHSALERRPSERAAFLDEACSGDESLHKYIDQLLTAHDKAESFIERPAIAVEARGLARQGANGNTQLTTGQIFGHYKILEQLGAGGMGEVYLAEDTALGRKVALKLLPAEFSRDLDRVRRFQQEARAASALNHPNIITIHEITQVDDRHLIATEFIDGKTLRERIRESRSPTCEDGSEKAGTALPIREVLNIGIQIADALAAAHEAGIAHRDIKPENIMVRRRDGYIKVLDFGLAKLTPVGLGGYEVDREAATRPQVKTSAGLVMGTVTYMSPEQTRGEKVEARTDIWSLGVVLYELVAGCAPFDRPTPSEVIAAILEHDPPPLTRYVRDAPIELERIVAKALRKEKEERYQAVRDMLLDLKTLKHRLEFEAELEHATPPAASVEGTTGSGETTALNAEFIASSIRQHRGSFTVAFTVLVLLIAFGYGYWIYNRSASTVTQIKSIAVLPFKNESGNPDVEYLSDGMTESLINSLSQLPNLRVMARSTMFSFKGKGVDPQAVGKQLGVDTVLTGRVVQLGDSLTIQTDLVKVSEGTQMWGERYSRKASDVLAVQEDMVREIVGKLRLRLSGEQEQRAIKRYTENVEAYQLYLKGRFYWNKRRADNLKKAIEQFRAAVEKDPNYALAYVGLADCYVLLEQYAGTPTSETLPQAKAYAIRALAIDDSLAEAHASLGTVNGHAWQWVEAEREYKRAIELNPNYPTAHHWYSIQLKRMGRLDEAFREIKRAQELDPLSNVINGNVAVAYLLKNDFNSAIEQSLKIIELDPNFGGSYDTLGLAYVKQGRNSEAIAALEKGVELTDRASFMLAFLGHVYALSGKQKEAIAIIKELEEKYANGQAIGSDIAAVYAGLGGKDAAFAWLEKDFQAHSGILPSVRWYPQFEPLRSDPRFADLLRRMGLPQ